MKSEITLKTMAALVALAPATCWSTKHYSKNEISKLGMHIKWHYGNQRIHFTLNAPTAGWLAIGFNDTEQLSGTYLLMANVIGEKTNVVEHYTVKPGNYSPISELGGYAEVKDVQGVENEFGSTISFSLPIAPTSKFKKPLKQGSEYSLLIAFSQEDDFQHHSLKRTAVPIIL
ncbi:DOMON domain-containing protein [Flagellimonas sp. S3867]|uniref:DOMON domain-containing protein n=1 Tax=Flagellimonas sp. S3867 TaxID=2768063 RepID=UPI00168583AF|nr:DOMON domain-containing protein [Flagellimonas sp. S3867]